jgi:hypothetical protein
VERERAGVVSSKYNFTGYIVCILYIHVLQYCRGAAAAGIIREGEVTIIIFSNTAAGLAFCLLCP